MRLLLICVIAIFLLSTPSCDFFKRGAWRPIPGVHLEPNEKREEKKKERKKRRKDKRNKRKSAS